VGTLHEWRGLGVGFISRHDAWDFITPPGRALAGMLAIIAECAREMLRERIIAGIAQARKRGTRHGRPPTVAHHAAAMRQLSAAGLSKSAMARWFGISQASVWRFLGG
jgi:putative DNA-invertase from lambdoid prophage Rac